MSNTTARSHFAITPSDSTAIYADAVFVGVAGTVTIKDRDGTSVQYTAPAGAVIPVQATAVMATGTAATGIVGLLY
jgi:hypothetical protein